MLPYDFCFDVTTLNDVKMECHKQKKKVSVLVFTMDSGCFFNLKTEKLTTAFKIYPVSVTLSINGIEAPDWMLKND